MAERWEYAILLSRRDPAQGGGPPKHWFQSPTDEKVREVEADDLVKYLNMLGHEGWEMVGPPIRENAVFTYKAASDVYHDKGAWVERQYHFKRRKV